MSLLSIRPSTRPATRSLSRLLYLSVYVHGSAGSSIRSILSLSTLCEKPLEVSKHLLLNNRFQASCQKSPSAGGGSSPFSSRRRPFFVQPLGCSRYLITPQLVGFSFSCLSCLSLPSASPPLPATVFGPFFSFLCMHFAFCVVFACRIAPLFSLSLPFLYRFFIFHFYLVENRHATPPPSMTFLLFSLCFRKQETNGSGIRHEKGQT